MRSGVLFKACCLTSIYGGARFKVPFKGYNSDRTVIHFQIHTKAGILNCYISNYTVAYQGIEFHLIGASFQYSYEIVGDSFYMTVNESFCIPYAGFEGRRAEEMYQLDFELA